MLGYDDLDEDEEEDEDEDDEMGEGSDYESDDLGTGKGKQAADEEDEDLGGWGPSKKDYYNADAIETEQDALDEEAEARRIQKKQLQAMTEADFGFDEEEWLGQTNEEEGASKKVVTEVLPQIQITDSMTEDEKLKILHSRYPEFEPIRQDYLRLQAIHQELKSAAEEAEALIKNRKGKKDIALGPKPNAVIKYWACASYLGAICMYFSVLTSPAKDNESAAMAIDPAELHQHPIMEDLLKSQKLWLSVEHLPLDDVILEVDEASELSVIEEASPEPETAITRKKADKKPPKKQSKAERAAALAQAEAEARRAEKLRQTEQDLANLSSLTDKAALRKSTKQKKKPPTADQPLLNLVNADDSDFGEETALTAHELAEKARKKKSLRFYTSQITQKASKRGAAGKDQGGDADIPHRERLKDRQARLQAEAERRGQTKDKGPGVPLGEDDGFSSDEEDRDGRGRVSGRDGHHDDDEDEDDYYDMVAARNQSKKAEKQERAAAYALAAKENAVVIPEETIGADGKRKITYQIAKNKGMDAPPFVLLFVCGVRVVQHTIRHRMQGLKSTLLIPLQASRRTAKRSSATPESRRSSSSSRRRRRSGRRRRFMGAARGGVGTRVSLRVLRAILLGVRSCREESECRMRRLCCVHCWGGGGFNVISGLLGSASEMGGIPRGGNVMLYDI